MKLTIKDLKNTVKVAKHTGQKESFSAHKKDSDRDIKIVVTYSPKCDIQNDIYPYWMVDMKEEELSKSVMFKGHELREVKELHNGFISQSENESFISRPEIMYL